MKWKRIYTENSTPHYFAHFCGIHFVAWQVQDFEGGRYWECRNSDDLTFGVGETLEDVIEWAEHKAVGCDWNSWFSWEEVRI